MGWWVGLILKLLSMQRMYDIFIIPTIFYKEVVMKFLPVLISAIFLSGCATIISGDTETVTFNSSPEGADVYIDGAIIGKTPVSIVLEKNKKDVVMLKKEGYQAVTRDLTKSYDPITMLSIFWDLSTTDFLSGAAMEYAPKSYYIELREK